jgi:hypothetical protein
LPVPEQSVKGGTAVSNVVLKSMGAAPAVGQYLPVAAYRFRVGC